MSKHCQKCATEYPEPELVEKKGSFFFWRYVCPNCGHAEEEPAEVVEKERPT